MVKVRTPWKQHIDPPRPAEEEEAGLAFYMADKNKT